MNKNFLYGIVVLAAGVGFGYSAGYSGQVTATAVQAETLAVPQVAPAITEARVREIIRDEVAKNPKMVLDSLNAYVKEQQAADAKSVDQQAVAKKADIAQTEKLPYYGNKDGKIELVYFFDVNCGYCKRLDPSIKRVVKENPDVRVSLREIPILAKSSHLAAFMEGLVWKKHPEAYLGFHDSLMGNQGSLSEAAVEAKLAAAVGAEEAKRLLASADDIDNDLDARDVNNQIQENLAIAKAAGISGTPFVYFVQGDGLLRGAGEDAYEQLNDLLAKARAAKS